MKGNHQLAADAIQRRLDGKPAPARNGQTSENHVKAADAIQARLDRVLRRQRDAGEVRQTMTLPRSVEVV